MIIMKHHPGENQVLQDEFLPLRVINALVPDTTSYLGTLWEDHKEALFANTDTPNLPTPIEFMLFLQKELTDVYQRTGEVTKVEDQLFKYKWNSTNDFEFVKRFMEFKALATRYSQITEKEYSRYGSFLKALSDTFTDSEMAAQQRPVPSADHPWRKYEHILNQLCDRDLASVQSEPLKTVDLLVKQL
jgi:hypothetical protein